MQDRPHILVVDDDTRLRQLLRRYLSENGFRVTTASDASEARDRMRGLIFDLLIVDVMMPGEDGLALTRSLRESSRIPILLLTAKGETEDRIRGLEYGADDYLVKPFEPRELYLRIRMILSRVSESDNQRSVRLGSCIFDLARSELKRDNSVVSLTTIETVLLSTLAQEIGTTFSREELKRRCRIEGSERAVDVHVSRLRHKIEPDSTESQYLRTVRSEGYVLLAD